MDHFSNASLISVTSEIEVYCREDELDHLTLKERMKTLISSRPFGDSELQRVLPSSCYTSLTEEAPCVLQSFEKVKTESPPVDAQFSVEESYSDNDTDSNATKLYRTSTLYFPNNAIRGCRYTISQCSLKTSGGHDNVSFRASNAQESKETDVTSSSQKSTPEVEAAIVRCNQLNANNEQLHSAMSNFPISVKVETLENGLSSPCDNALGCFSNGDVPAVKVEKEIPDDMYVDEVEHIPLQDRIKMLVSSRVSNLDYYGDLNCSKQTLSCAFEHEVDSVKFKEQGIPLRRKRKRKKIATDSVETALEEDAPGLLQVLTEKGISTDEIKLYGLMENEEALDVSSIEESFSDLETVISKLFSQRSSFFKFASARHTKGSRSNYCLACLVSLVEQTRYLRFRKIPVEWGWCRDLQSFIFVFERHNRIVLERPEYGYATYFFELVESLPIDWQIKRLVTAMKLSSCSRTTLIENRSLLVGEDLTEGEARVLEEYGWRPNSGLGSMLNYCDRVVHDRKNEGDYSEWRSKIRTLLMNGYDGGIIVMANLPKKAIEYKSEQGPQIKVEI